MESSGHIPRGGTLARQIRDALVERILSGELLPGTHLKDSEVAAMFGTSTTPAREALRLLARDGLADIVPFRGCVVPTVDAQEILEILDAHMLIAGRTASLVAPRLTEEHWRELEAAVDEYDRAAAAGERRQARQAAGRFYQLLTEAAGNRILAKMRRYLSNRLLLARCPYLETLADGVPCREVLEALRARDGERAEAIITQYIARSNEQVRAALAAAR